MTRLIIEIGLAVAVLILGFEAVHYRQAVLEANVDRNRAWHTVVELRGELEKRDSADAGVPAETRSHSASAGTRAR